MEAGIQEQHPLPLRMLYKWLTEMLVDAVKFVLPDNGMLFADQDFDPRMFGLQRLPYPICAFEFMADDSFAVPAEGTTPSKRRIALAFDPHALSLERKLLLSLICEQSYADVSTTFPAHCIAVQAIFDFPGMNTWGTSLGLSLTDLDGFPPRVDCGADMTRVGEGERRFAPEVKGREHTKHGILHSFHGFLPIFDLVGIEHDEGLKTVEFDTNDEALVVYEALAVLNCKNVSVASESAPLPLNEKRRKKGKIPFFEYKVLEVGGGKGSGGGEDRAGTHASPRMHLRRGHLRHQNEQHGGGVIWINSTIVNPGSKLGVVQKAYKVVPSSV